MRLTMSLIMRTASAMALAWKPVVVIWETISATVMSRSLYLLKSTPLTSWTPSGTVAEGLRTASVDRDGACPLRAPLVLFSSMVGRLADLWLGNGLEIYSL